MAAGARVVATAAAGAGATGGAVAEAVLGPPATGTPRLELTEGGRCDAPNPGCPLTTHQRAEILYVSYRETHT